MESLKEDDLKDSELLKALRDEMEHSQELDLDEDEEEDGWESEAHKKERTRAKLLEMGMDPAIVDQDPDLVEALMESMLAEEQMAREKAQKAKAEEKAKAAKAEEEEERQRKKEAEEKLRLEMGEEAFAALKPKFTKLDVKVGRNVVF